MPSILKVGWREGECCAHQCSTDIACLIYVTDEQAVDVKIPVLNFNLHFNSFKYSLSPGRATGNNQCDQELLEQFKLPCKLIYVHLRIKSSALLSLLQQLSPLCLFLLAKSFWLIPHSTRSLYLSSELTHIKKLPLDCCPRQPLSVCARSILPWLRLQLAACLQIIDFLHATQQPTAGQPARSFLQLVKFNARVMQWRTGPKNFIPFFAYFKNFEGSFPIPQF